jgi:hypothetical protein
MIQRTFNEAKRVNVGAVIYFVRQNPMAAGHAEAKSKPDAHLICPPTRRSDGGPNGRVDVVFGRIRATPPFDRDRLPPIMSDRRSVIIHARRRNYPKCIL